MSKRKPNNCVCLICGTGFHVKPYKLTVGRGKYCSRICKGKAQTGWWKDKKNPRWNNGKYINDAGYVFISAPKHPYVSVRGYVREHRLVMEQHLGRYLNPQEKVHHKNGIKNDNRIENLELMSSQSEHVKLYHKDERGFYGKVSQGHNL